ncbi:MAG: hypothetical protein PHT12_05570 [Patescibacteria group bacterium]|nr:hypothetical protein [Patescibacteria group bacterium]
MKHLPIMTFRFVVRLAAALAVVGVFVFLAAKALAPGGELTMRTDLIRPAPSVSAPKPPNRLQQLDAGGVAFVGTPAYLDVTPPSAFDTVEVRVNYRNPTGAWLEVGAMTSALDGSFDLRPLEARLADVLPWARVTSGRRQVIERERRQASVEAFEATPPSVTTLATLGSRWLPPVRIADYRPAEEERAFRVSLRGRQRLLAYVANETLHFGFSVQDMNRQVGADPVTVAVFRPGDSQPLAVAELPDDGNVTADQRSVGLRSISVSVADLPEGVYQVEFATTGDVFIREMTASPAKFVFAGRMYLGDHVAYSDRTDPVTVYASGTRLEARTGHQESLQTITVGSSVVSLEAVNARQATTLPAGEPVAVRVPKADAILESDGVFALSREAWFVARPLEISWHTTADDLDKRGITAVLADYEAPSVADGVSTASAEFAVSELDQTAAGAYRFVLHAPEAAFGETAPVIESVEFVWRRRSVSWAEAWSRIRERATLLGHARLTAVGRIFDESPE